MCIRDRIDKMQSDKLIYFDKSISDLSYDEAALLAALPKAPSKYNPYRDKELAKFNKY